MRGRGVPDLTIRGKPKGDQHVTFKIAIPKTLTEAQKRLIQEAFGEKTEEKTGGEKVAGEKASGEKAAGEKAAKSTSDSTGAGGAAGTGQKKTDDADKKGAGFFKSAFDRFKKDGKDGKNTEPDAA